MARHAATEGIRMTPLAMSLLLGGIGLVALLLAAELFVRVSTKLAAAWHISPLITSLLIVALGTNIPELAVSVGAIANKDPGFALGNLIGSCIANIGLIFGASVLLGKVRPGTVKTQINARMLLAVTLLFTTLSLLHVDFKLQALLLLGASLTTMVYQFILGIRGRKQEDREDLAASQGIVLRPGQIFLYLVLLCIAIALVWIGGGQVAKTIETISLVFGISTSFLGLTLTGIATSLPELLTALTASFKRQNKVVIGTVLGSNLFNLTLFPALVFGTIGSWYISPLMATMLVTITLVFVGVLFRFPGKYIPRLYGAVLLSLYLLFIFVSAQLQATV